MQHPCPAEQGGHASPPQSTSVSVPPHAPSTQFVVEGDDVGDVEGIAVVGVVAGGGASAPSLDVAVGEYNANN